MKLIEIYQSPSRNENNEQYIHHFSQSSPTVYIHQPSGHKLKRSMDTHGDIRYGLFDSSERKLISYAHFSDSGKGWYISSMPSTDVEYQKQGWISLIFEYAVNHDHIKIMSDDQHTSEARQMWRSLKSRGLFDVEIFDIATNTILPWTPENDPYAPPNETNYRLVALPRSIKTKHVNEGWSSQRGPRAERRRQGIYDYGQYGPGTSTTEFINW